MIYASKYSKDKIVHYGYCRYAKQILKTNRICFQSMEEAKAAGYEFCKCCVTIKGFVRSEYKLIKEYKKKYEMICKIKEDGLEIISRKDKWMVIEKGSPAEFELYHKNKKKSREKTEIPDYHRQKVDTVSIAGHLEYIVEHDIYRKRHPLYVPPRKGTRRYRAMMQRNKTQKCKQEIENVLKLIERLDL